MNSRQGWTFLGILKNIFFFLLFLQVVPGLISSIKNNIDDVITSDKVEVGYLNLSGMIIDSAVYTKAIQKFAHNKSIQGLIIKVESPGGMPGSSQAILRELSFLKIKKPIVAFVENCCASGSYYAVCCADSIITNASAVIGSIGVVMRAHNVNELLESCKVKHTFIQAGEFKTSLDPYKQINPTEVNFLQHLTNDTYDQFITDVAAQRGLDKNKHKKWADGKIFTGRQAVALHLADSVGSYSDALNAMAVLLKTKSENLKLVSSGKGMRGLVRRLIDEDDGYASEASVSLADYVARFCVAVYQQASTMLAAQPVQLQV